MLSSMLVAALHRKYWKPIQTGATEGTDRETVMKWVGIPLEQTCPECYLFGPAVSPHLAAQWDGTVIDMSRIERPATTDALIIEGAGGVYVPVNDGAFMLDLMVQLQAPAVVASRTALGTINHTVLTVSAIRNAGVEVRGVVMIGEENPDNCRAVERYGNVPVIGSIPRLGQINRTTLCRVFEKQFDRRAFQ